MSFGLYKFYLFICGLTSLDIGMKRPHSRSNYSSRYLKQRKNKLKVKNTRQIKGCSLVLDVGIQILLTVIF